MLAQQEIPWFKGAIFLVASGLIALASVGLAQNATDANTTPAAANEPAETEQDTTAEPAADQEPAAAEEPPAEINSGDTAWMIVATALVLFMTIPGLSLFYGGLVRSKNILSILVQCFAITSIIT